VYGIHTVAEALGAGRVRHIRVADRSDARIRRLLDDAGARGVRIEQVDRDALDRLAGGARHQGVVAEVEDAPEVTLDQMTRTVATTPLVVVLDGVEDPQNVGAVLRSADAAGATGVVRQARRAAPLDGAVARASAGAV